MLSLKILMPTLLILLVQYVHGQDNCNLSQIQSSNYMVGSCNGLTFQSSIGTISQIYGSCNGLNFDSPLFGGDISTKTEELHKDISFHVYPNPSYDHINVAIKGISTYNLKLSSLVGNTIWIKENESLISIEELEKGYYILQLFDQTGKLFKSEKIIKI